MTFPVSFPNNPVFSVRPKSLVLFTMCLAVFIAQLDTSVVNLALKHIGASLDATVSQLQWVVDAYNLVYASFLLTAGILGDRFGHRATLLAGFALFGVGSLICGIAPEAMSLIAGRAITGLGAAFVIPASLAILSVAYPDHKERAHAIGVWASANSVAWLVGPAAGGLVVDYSGWRAIFLVIVPVSLLGCALGFYGVKESKNGGKRGIDPAGQILAVLVLGSFSFGFIEAHHLGMGSPWIVASFALAIVSAILFIVVETRTSDPLIPGFLFGQVRFPAALFGAATMTFSMYATIFLLPIYLQSVLHDSAFLAGIQLLPMPIGFFFVGRASGKLAVRFGPRAMMVSGELTLAVGMLLLASLGARTDTLGLVIIEVATALLGIGLGLNTGPAVSVAVASAPESHSGAASGILNTARIVGATFGVAILGAVFAAKAGQSAASAEAVAEGFRYAMLGSALSVLLGAATALLFIRKDALQRPAPITSSSE
jgi:DHA2 family methylenomycin A resistance protein-like MFS transporter